MECSTCKYFKCFRSDYRGHCFRYPPVPVYLVYTTSALREEPEVTSDVRYERPEVENSDWCGEYKEDED